MKDLGGNPKQILELRNIMTEMKNLLKRIKWRR